MWWSSSEPAGHIIPAKNTHTLRIWVIPAQTLVTEEQLLPLHPLPLWGTETQDSFELGQDATGLLPLPALTFPLLRWQHVRPRPSAFTVRVWIRHVGLPLLVEWKSGRDLQQFLDVSRNLDCGDIISVKVHKISGEKWTCDLTSSSGTGSLSRIKGYDGGGAGISDTGVPHCSRPSALPAAMMWTYITATTTKSPQ